MLLGSSQDAFVVMRHGRKFGGGVVVLFSTQLVLRFGVGLGEWRSAEGEKEEEGVGYEGRSVEGCVRKPARCSSSQRVSRYEAPLWQKTERGVGRK